MGDDGYVWVAGPSGTGCISVCSDAGSRVGTTLTSVAYVTGSNDWLNERFTAAGVYSGVGSNGFQGPGCDGISAGSNVWYRTYITSGGGTGIVESDSRWGDCYGGEGLSLAADNVYSDNIDGSLCKCLV